MQVKYTPNWLLQAIGDGALGLVYFLPNVIGLLLYSVAVFFVIDLLMSRLRKAFTKGVARGLLAEFGRPVDAKGPRIRAYLPVALGWLLKLWIGVPMVYVFNMIVSEDPQSRHTLAMLIGGYDWQPLALQRLPLPFWPGLREGDLSALLIQGALILIFLAYVYWYASTGFAIVRRMRKVGDALIAKVGAASGSPSPEQILSFFHAQGWAPSSLKAAAFFLSMIRMRIMWVSPIYEQLTARQYGLYQVLQDIGIAGALLALHPVASGLYVAFKLKGGKKMLATRTTQEKNFANLPEEIKSQAS